ncbi:MAG TPA: hypothetical protein VFG04_26320 [Planctomycetaceae bacterium]|nr:hypothetical protein [Planctomycetaceae bacterium]
MFSSDVDHQEVDPKLVPGLIDLRLRLLETNKDAAGCRRTAELWEALNPETLFDGSLFGGQLDWSEAT